MSDDDSPVRSDTDGAPMSGSPSDSTGDVADRRARAARIRRRSLELIEALGADHPLVAEALARADALDGGAGSLDSVDLRSAADLSG